MFMQKEMREQRERMARKARELDALPGWAERLMEPDTLLEPAPGTDLLPRGVRLSPFLSPRGEPVWFAVDSQHRCVKSLTVRGERTEPLVRSVLAGLLEQVDPVRLRIMR